MFPEQSGLRYSLHLLGVSATARGLRRGGGCGPREGSVKLVFIAATRGIHTTACSEKDVHGQHGTRC